MDNNFDLGSNSRPKNLGFLSVYLALFFFFLILPLSQEIIVVVGQGRTMSVGEWHGLRASLGQSSWLPGNSQG